MKQTAAKGTSQGLFFRAANFDQEHSFPTKKLPKYPPSDFKWQT
jgi:hypothetical protein